MTTPDNQKALTQAEYARYRATHFGFPKSRQAIAKAIKDGRITTEPDGKIIPAKADIEYDKKTRPRCDVHGLRPSYPDSVGEKQYVPAAHSESSTPARRIAFGNRPKVPVTMSRAEIPPSPAEVRDRQKHYAAERERLKYQQESGDLVRAADVRRVWQTIARMISGNLLTLPRRVSVELSTIQTADEVERKLEIEIRSILATMQTDLARKWQNDAVAG